MTEAEKNEIVGLVMTEISSQAVDFDITTEQPQANDLLTAVREVAGRYVGVTLKWDDVARIATELANQAAVRAEQAETDANNILTQVQSKGTEITNFVATSKAEIETQKDESVNAVKSVYQIDLNELKGDLDELSEVNYIVLSRFSTELTKHPERGYLNPEGSFVSNSGYYLYYIVMPRNGYIWFEDNEWLRVAVYRNKLFDTNNLIGYYYTANGDIPKEDNKLFVQKNDIIAVNCNTSIDTKYDFKLHIPNDLVLNAKQKELVKQYIRIDEKKPKCIYRQIEGSEWNSIYYSDHVQVWNDSINNVKPGKVLSIYIPTKVGYLQFNFGKSWSGKTSAGEEVVGGYDIWRMCVLWAVDDSLNKRFEITRPGEWEMACRIVGRPDFIGGYEHGDEYGTVLRVYVDGKLTDVESITELTEFNYLKLVCVSDMYDPNDHATKVGVHAKEWVFSDGIATLTQSIQWKFNTDTEMTTSYLTMLPLIRGNDTISEKQITSKFFDDIDFSERDCSVYGFDGNMSPDVRKMTVYSKESGVFASVEVLEYPDYPSSRYNYLNNIENTANKMYFGVCGYGSTKGTVVPNQVWKQKSIYKIEICEGTDEPDAVTN